MIPTFDSAVAHRRMDTEAWTDIYVVGDVHGCSGPLEKLLRRLDPAPDDLLVFVGDLVRKGPDSKGVIERVRGMDNAVSVLGNTEAEFLGGDESLPSLSDADRAFMRSMPVVVSWADSLVVHGGVDHRKPLAEHTATELLNYRSMTGDDGYTRPLWFEHRCESPRVFFGHTVLAEPFATEFAVGLDTGCVHGGQLTAYDCTRDRFVAVDAPETYQPRSTDRIVEPEPDLECRA